jgi:L-asparagine permease
MGDSEDERPVLALVPLIALVLWVGWRTIKRRFPVDF